GVAPAVQGMQDIGGRIAGAVTGAMDAAQQGLQNVQNAIPQGLRDAGGFAAEKLTDAAAATGRMALGGATNLAVGAASTAASLAIGAVGAGVASAAELAVRATGYDDAFSGVVAGAGLYQGRQFSEAEIARAAGLQQVIQDNETYIKSLRAQKEAIENANSPSYIADATRRNAMMDELDYRILPAQYESEQAYTAIRDVAGHHDPKEGQNWGQRISGQIGNVGDVFTNTHLRDVFYRANNPSNSSYINNGSVRDIATIGLAGYEERLYTLTRQYERTVDSDTRSIRDSSEQKALERAAQKYLERNKDAIANNSGGTSLRDVTSGRWQQSVAESRQSPLTKIADSARSSFDSARSSLGNTLSNPPRKAEQDGWYEETPTQHKKDYGDYEAPKRTR
ncbi:MAG: hypothetical protein LW855_00085, partial [Alphaproteobacteria bacterium]|nr:hypothetical protein [Alphaproteobacteria bacterium]